MDKAIETKADRIINAAVSLGFAVREVSVEDKKIVITFKKKDQEKREKAEAGDKPFP